MGKTQDGQDAGNGSQPKARAPYTKPGLIEYGSVADLTAAIGSMGSPDGGAVAGADMVSI